MVYEIEFASNADKDLERMPQEIVQRFLKHVRRMIENPSRKHLMHGIPYFVEKVSEQARLIYEIYDNKVYIVRCFQYHKDYEKWYKSFK